MNYIDFIKNKGKTTEANGFKVDREYLHPSLFDHQRDITAWALRKGKSAVFAGTGLGKTRIQLEWAHQICKYTDGDVLILAPLTVAGQTVQEAAAMGYDAKLCRSQSDVNPGVNITNYEMLHHFEPLCFEGIVLDESSILKSFTGKV
ncbi:MAG: helicase, partial [Clostridiales bacterium]